mgnify:CR=1 FL=1
MLDNYQRNINYLRLSVTDLCNLKCRYCMPNGAVKCTHDEILRIEELVKIVKALTTLGIDKVRITGGEPLIRRGVVSLVEQISPLVKTVAMTTNGVRLADMGEDLKRAGLHSLNISIDTLDPDLYKEITAGGNLTDALNGINKAKELGFPMKLNTVLVGGINENALPDLAGFSAKNNAVLRFIELMPFESTGDFFEKHFVPASQIINKYDLKYTGFENNCAYYDYNGQKIGFITPISNKFCSSCNRIRVTAKGTFIPCLHCRREYDLKPYLFDEKALTDYCAECIKAKPEHHNLSVGEVRDDMFNIGG